MDRYDYHRVVSWIAFHAGRGKSWAEICALNSGKKAPLPQSDLDACRADGLQAVHNAEVIDRYCTLCSFRRHALAADGTPVTDFPDPKLCELVGCRWPQE